MQPWFATVALIAACSSLAPAAKLEVGGEVSLEAVQKASWIQGKAPESFEGGKVYIFECWATWCGPCVASIPHLNELHEKFSDKGLRVHGMNVWEDDKGSVKAFVKKQGKGMSYPVAFTGDRGSAFDKAWLQATGTTGIPTAFIVINGKLIRKTHPGSLTDDVIESLLAEAAKSAPPLPPPAPVVRKPAAVLADFQAAAAANNTDTMAALIKELETLDPKHPTLIEMRMDLLVAKQDWSSATSAVEVMFDSPGGMAFFKKLTHKVVMDATRTYPPEWLKMLATAHANSRKQEGLTALDHVGLAMLYWRADDRDKARSHADQAAESAKSGDAATADYFAKFATGVRGGTMPTMKDFHAAMPRRPEAPQ